MKYELLGNLSKIVTGKLDVNASDLNGKYPFFTCAALPYKINDYAFDFEAILIAGNGDLNVKYYNGKFNAYQRTYVIEIIKHKEIDCKYLYYFMKNYIETLRRMSIGGIIKYIKLNFLTEAKIPLPPLKDQIQIANLLTRAENLIAKRKESIKVLDDLLKSTFLEMFGDPVKNEKGWEEKVILDACENKNDIKCGPFGTQLSKSEFQKTGVPLWGIPQINSQFKINPVDFLTKEKAVELSEYSIEENDIIMSRKGTVGKCSLYPAKLPSGVMHSDVLRIRISKKVMNPIFLCYQLRISKKVERQIDGLSKGAIMAGINVGKLKSIDVLFPPIKLQTQFANFVEKAENLKSKYVKSLNCLETFYSSLSQQSFLGNLGSIKFFEKEI